MKTIKGPGIFLAQFAGDAAPYNTLDGMAGWAAGHGYVGIQIPSWDRRLIDLERAAESQAYCDEVKGEAARHGLAITESQRICKGSLWRVIRRLIRCLTALHRRISQATQRRKRRGLCSNYCGRQRRVVIWD